MVRMAFAVALVLSLGACTARPPVEEASMTQENKAVVRGYLEALMNRQDSGAWEKHLAENIQFDGQPMTREGFRGIREWFLTGFPDLQVTVADQVAEGDLVVSRVVFRGTHSVEFEGIAPTGKTIEFWAITMDRIAEGKVVEMWHALDTASVIRQLRST